MSSYFTKMGTSACLSLLANNCRNIEVYNLTFRLHTNTYTLFASCTHSVAMWSPLALCLSYSCHHQCRMHHSITLCWGITGVRVRCNIHCCGFLLYLTECYISVALVKNRVNVISSRGCLRGMWPSPFWHAAHRLSGGHIQLYFLALQACAATIAGASSSVNWGKIGWMV